MIISIIAGIFTWRIVFLAVLQSRNYPIPGFFIVELTEYAGGDAGIDVLLMVGYL